MLAFEEVLLFRPCCSAFGVTPSCLCVWQPLGAVLPGLLLGFRWPSTPISSHAVSTAMQDLKNKNIPAQG